MRVRLGKGSVMFGGYPSAASLRALAESMKDIPPGYVGNTTCGWVNNCTTASAPNLDELVKISREMMAERDRVNAGLVEALNKHIARSGESLQVWAERLWVNFTDLVETLAGRQPVSGYFWDQVRRVFEPMRPTYDFPVAPLRDHLLNLSNGGLCVRCGESGHRIQAHPHMTCTTAKEK